MCDFISRAAADDRVPEASRRGFLAALAATAGGTTLAWAGVAGAQAAQPRGGRSRTRLLLLGTAGGPALVTTAVAGVSTAVMFKDRVYIVDLGLGAIQRLRESAASGPLGAPNTFNKVRGMFFTHMHSDHLMDWPAAWAMGTINAQGRQGPRIQVFGPGDRGSLPRVFPPTRPEPALYGAADPTPGIAAMSRHLTQAWAADFNDRARDSNFSGPDTLFDVHDIDLGGVWAPDPQGRPPLLSEPLEVWSDDDVRVTATLVDHHPTAPAFGYRFDTPDGSVTISGDTAVSENLIALAKDTDFLVHEVIDADWVARLVATLPPEVGGPLQAHLLESHTTIEQVGRDVAQRAGAKSLVLTHYGPAGNPASRWRRAQRGYDGRLILGEDLMEVVVR